MDEIQTWLGLSGETIQQWKVKSDCCLIYSQVVGEVPSIGQSENLWSAGSMSVDIFSLPEHKCLEKYCYTPGIFVGSVVVVVVVSVVVCRQKR